MPSINRFGTVTTLNPGDLAALYSQSNGTDVAATLATLVTFLQTQLTAGNDLVTQYSAPNAAGFAVTVAPLVSGGGVFLLLTPTATFAAGTVTLPAVASCVDKQSVLVHCTQIVTTLTVAGNGATVSGAPTALAAGGFFRLRFDGVFKNWYRVA